MKNYRRCISCRHLAPKTYFWRVVRNYQDRQIQLDRGLGRSAYICPRKDCLMKAKQKNRLQKALKTAVSEQIYQTLEDRLPRTAKNIRT